MSSKHGMSGDPFLSIYLPSTIDSLLAWRCLTGGQQCSTIMLLTKEELEAHIFTHGGKHMLRLMRNPTMCLRICERVCRICMQKSDSLEGHGCNLDDFAPTEEAPAHEVENTERQSSSPSPSPEVEMVEEVGGSQRPKSPTNHLLQQQVEDLLNRSKDISKIKN